MKTRKKIIFILLILIYTFQTLFAGVIGSTTRTSTLSGGIYYESKRISSNLISSTTIDGTSIVSFLIEPISKGSTYLNGKIYSGIELSCVKMEVLKLDGEEKATNFFLNPVIEDYSIDWAKVISQFAVGTTVIFITGIVHLVSSQSVPVFFVTSAEMFTGAITGAITGAATDALIAGLFATLEGKPKEGIYKTVIESAVSSYMWGAIGGAISGGLSGKGKITSSVNDDLSKFLKKGTITLKESQVDDILEHPDLLKDVIRAYTGENSIKDGFMEFFVRLAKGNQSQTNALLQNNVIHEMIAKAIRAPGGNHEWLMVKNFMRYLVNPPANWSADDGLRAAVAINKLVQATSGETGVVLRSGLSHKAGGSELAKWHMELSNVIDESLNFNDAVNKIYQFGKNTLTADSAQYLKEIIKSL